VTRARVLTFHIDSHHLPALTKALDGVVERCNKHSDFRGLVCLEHDNVRDEIIVITLWDGQGLETTVAEAEVSRQQIADAVDLGVSSKCYEVLRLVPGPAALEAALAEALGS